MDFFKDLAESFISNKAISYEEFQKEIDNCTNCRLSKTRNNIVCGTGPIPSQIMLIGEGPGETEDKKGVPFIGRSGQLLTQFLEEKDIKREEIFITNIVKCRPPENRNPKKDESLSCKKFLLRQIILVKPQILILVGSPSMKFVLGNKLTITKARGSWLYKDVPYMKEPLAIMPIFHPSYLLRYGSKEKGKPRWLTSSDILNIKKKSELLKK